MHGSLRTIESEHRSISAVLAGLLHFVDQGLAGQPMPEARVFRAMLQYLDLFAERMHHPKEDRELFRRLRSRAPDADAILDRLQGDHFEGAEAIRALEQSFLRFEEGGAPFFDGFARQVQDYVTFYRDHMRTEEVVLFPLAEAVLTEDDWRAIDAAFAAHRDPLASLGEERDLKALFTHIVNITPAPVGVGPALASS
jgi:hemerythrin-like domain-containing protein